MSTIGTGSEQAATGPPPPLPQSPGLRGGSPGKRLLRMCYKRAFHKRMVGVWPLSCFSHVLAGNEVNVLLKQSWKCFYYPFKASQMKRLSAFEVLD